jgi:proton-coupled amino acid transporter
MGDFVNLLGSFSLVPLTFMFPSMLFLKVSISVRKYKTHSVEYYYYVMWLRVDKKTKKPNWTAKLNRTEQKKTEP